MDFTKYSFSQLVATATQFVQNAPGWGNSFNSSFGQTVIQLMAQMVEQLNYMLERRTQEAFMISAQLQSSIWALASAIGYRPTRKISANGQIQVQLTDVNGLPVSVATGGTVTIPKYTQLTFGGQNFVNTADIAITSAAGVNGLSTGNTIKEGVVASMVVNPTDTTANAATLFQSTTNSNFVLLTNYPSIEDGSLLVSDANGPWYDVTTSINGAAPIGAVSFAGPTDRVYDIKINTQGMMVVFGDGVTGLNPTISMTFKWITSSGAAVNVVTFYPGTSNTFLLPTTTLGDNLVVNPANVYYYTILNTTAISGGLNEESVTTIQRQSSDFVRSANRAVNANDYAFWARKSGIGGVVDAVAYGQQEAGINPYQMNNVYLTYLTSNASTLSGANANALTTYLNNLDTMTSYVVLQPATVIPVEVALRVKKNPNLTMANAQFYALINAAVANFFPLARGSLGEEINTSAIISYLANYQLLNNNQNIPAASWVSLALYCLFAVTVPLTVSTIPVTITAGTTGDNYRLVINGTTYTYAMTAGQNAAQIANGLIGVLPGATVTATNPISVAHPGSVTSVNVTAAGGGYTNTAGLGFTLTGTGGSSAAFSGNFIAQTPTKQAAGSGYAVNDTITLTNNVVLKVTGVSSGAITTVSIQNGAPGGGLTGTMAANPVAQSSTSGSGTGATFNLDYGLNAVTVTNPGSGYTAVTSLTVSGGQGGTYTAVTATMTPVTASNYITLVNTVPNTTFTIDNAGSTVPANVGITQNIQLPPYLFANQNLALNNLFLPGSIQVVQQGTGTVLFTDNGAGTIAGGTVNYVTGAIAIPILPAGSYYIRYQQDVDQNLYSNNQCAFQYSAPNPIYGDATFYFSTTTIL